MNPAIASGYFADWRITWNGPNVHAPHPGGVIHAEGRTADGRYSNQLPTPLGTGMGLRPIRLMALPHEAEHLAADAALRGLAAGDHAGRG